MLDISPVPLDHFPCISMIAYTGRLVKLADVSLPLVYDLNGLEIKQNTPLLLDHEISKIVGLTMKVEIVNNALTAIGIVDIDLPAGRDVWRSGLLGFPWQASIGVTFSQSDYVDHGQHAEVNGRPVTGPCYIMRQVVLQEISLVDKGADSYTQVFFHPPRTTKPPT